MVCVMYVKLSQKFYGQKIYYAFGNCIQYFFSNTRLDVTIFVKNMVVY